MHKLPSSVRRTLQKDVDLAGFAFRSSSVPAIIPDSVSGKSFEHDKSGAFSNPKSIKWTIQSLSNLSITSTTPFASLTAERCSNTNERHLLPSVDAAQTLLRDVQVRLAQQHRRCMTMIRMIDKQGRETPFACINSSITKKDQNVIRAVNNVVSVQVIQQQKARERLDHQRQRATKALHNLEVLHANTYQLTLGHAWLLNSSLNDCQGEQEIHHQSGIEKGKAVVDYERRKLKFSSSDRNAVLATFEEIRSRHALTVETLAEVVSDLRNAIQQYKESNKCNQITDDHTPLVLQEVVVESFLRGRLGIQLLCDHYTGYAKYQRPYGGISVNCSLLDVIREAITEAKHICDANTGHAPDVHVRLLEIGSSDVAVGTNSDVEDIRITLIRPWVHHSLVELLKNAMSANIQICKTCVGADGEEFIPPLQIEVVSNPEHERLMIHIIDQGAGLDPTKCLDSYFQFAKTNSSAERWDRLQDQQSYATVTAPLAGLGVGLSQSRMMMQVFGGDVSLEDNASKASRLSNGRGDRKARGSTSTIILSTNISMEERNADFELGT